MPAEGNALTHQEVKVAIDALANYLHEILNELEDCDDEHVKTKIDLYMKNVSSVLEKLQKNNSVINFNELRVLNSAVEEYAKAMEKKLKKLSGRELEDAYLRSKLALSIKQKTRKILDTKSSIHLADL